jgi:hypothetical protein
MMQEVVPQSNAMRAVHFVVPLCFLACGGSTSADPVSTDAGQTAPPRVPKVHRAAATSCPTTRDPGSASAPPEFMNKCTSDAECTAGKNGRCYGSLSANICTYDECFSDADCKAAVCDCRNTGSLGLINKCFPGNCRTDADCGNNYCSPSATTLPAGCTGPTLGSYGYFCHTTSDECIDDADCGDAVTRCLFDPEVVHWMCIKTLCPR